MNNFASGYACAVTTLLRLDGCVSTNVKELFRAGGWSVKELERAGIDYIDLDLLKEHQAELEGQQEGKK